ncbi:NEDD4-binding protein 2 isoform X2 [Acipenser oxyrinchus oxyrinchus]|uniref:NEDD4-binding protein 2 isoform X2 n=1 Tax=Acipenser oxyrinchus oxyrinchus TaxID=40147 RepID=A0AAD8GJH0_ACIOX|nr:NEDD4-binding protein 2 isoform X2 [Acipenser oxyrinchus oxyrinchus]
MPRKKKSALQSPARTPANPSDGSTSSNDLALPSRETDINMVSSNLHTSSSSGKEEIVNSMLEMFSHLDSEVIYMVLSECDFKAEVAMDILLELSNAAEGAVIPAPLSGFESAAALLGQSKHDSSGAESRRKQNPPTKGSVFVSGNETKSPDSFGTHLTEDFDSLIEYEFETIFKKPHPSDLPSSASSSSNELPELIKSSLCNYSTDDQHISTEEQPADNTGHHGNLNLAVLAGQIPSQPDQASSGGSMLTDFSYLVKEVESDKPPLSFSTNVTSVAFKGSKYNSNPFSMKSKTVPRDADNNRAFGGFPFTDTPHHEHRINGNSGTNEQIHFKLPNTENNIQTALGNGNDCNIWPTEIHLPGPHIFITPVAMSPVWRSGLNLRPSGRAAPHLNSGAFTPASWGGQHGTQPVSSPMRPPLQGSAKRTVLVGKVLVLLRGAPGSGKSTLARNLLEQNPTGVILSTDDYFLCDGHYQYDRSALGEAHEWTQKRAKETFKKGLSPIIIDNTNIQGWEMKPYVALALQYNYKVMFREPDTWWKYKPRELERHTKHGVPKEKIKRMLEQYQRYVTVQNIMGSTNPKATEQRKDVQPSQEQEGHDEGSNTLMKPDVVEEPYFKPQPANSDFKVKSLPDVSSVKENINTDDTTYKSSSNTRYLSNDSIRVEGQSKYPTVEDELKDKGSSDVALYLENEVSSKGVDSKNNEDLSDNTGGVAAREVPVAFCESIGQRVRRQRRGNQDKDHQSDLKTHETLMKSDQSNPEDDNACVGNNFTRPELLSFVGDWPTQQILGQRNQRSRGSQASQCAREETESHVDKRKDGKDRMGIELKKLLDLLQDTTKTSNSEKCEAPTGDVLEQEGSALCSDLEKFNLESNVDTEEPCTSSETSVSLEDCRPELLNFVEDWPTTASSKERQQRLRIQNVEEHPSIEEKKELVVVKENTTVVDISESDPNKSCDSVGGVQSSLDRSESQISCTNQSVVKDTDRCIPPHSRDKKFKHIRRSGKQCKLALTFTNNSPPSLKSFDESPKIPQFDESPKTPQFDEVIPDTVTKSVSLVSTQATSEDFAFLWRVENQKVDAAGVKVLLGNANNFEPKCLDSTVLPELQQVPYRVDHDKGTQVEETEFDTVDKHNNLQILSEHFKSVSFDILQDLYEKCNQDMEWTTNLLLDSGEQLYKEDELVCTGLESTETVELPTGVSHVPLDALNLESSSINILDEHSASSADNLDDHEVLSEGQPEVGIEEPADGGSVKIDFSVGLEDCTRQLTVEGGNTDCRTAMEAGTNKPMPEQSKQIVGEDITLKDRLEAEAQCALSDIAETREGPGSLDPSLLLDSPSGESEGESTEVVEHPAENHASSTLSSRPAQMPKVESPTKQPSQKSLGSLNIQSLELCLPPELAFQLSDLFGPVGIDPGTLSLEDCVVQIDLNLAKLIHQKWKEAIQERQKQEVLSYQLLQENPLLSNDYQLDRLKGSWGGASVPGADGAFGQWESSEGMPFMDHWSAQAPHVSLKAIMSEEMALQEQYKKAKVTPVLGRKDGAAMLKEKQLFDMFPSIDRHFLMDIFRDNNYSLEQTEQFLKSLLDEGPVKTVVAQGSVHRSETPCLQKERRAKEAEAAAVDSLFQDTEDPDYDDYRTEALIQRRSQQECFSKAAEAYRKGMKEVATYYAQQGHLHGQQMKEANHRAAVRIFERVNASLLPQNVLDLHGLHVDEAIHHLKRVLQEKAAECQQSGGKPHLSVITGRGNHSQGGVARIKPAVMDYLASHGFRYTEPKPGLVHIMLR